MVVIPKGVGQLGNQLFHISHFTASAVQNDYRLHFPCFQYGLENFPNINSNPNVGIREVSAFRHRWQWRMFKGFRHTTRLPGFPDWISCETPPYYNLTDTNFISKAKRRIVFCDGFAFRDPKSIEKQKAEIKRLLAPHGGVKEETSVFLKKIIQGDGAVLVGFHVRRGDYEHYEDGRFFLSRDEWREVFRLVKALIKSKGGTFVGVLSTNDAEFCQSLLEENIFLGPGSLYTDLEVLKNCDYIVAPPSTYSGWASFYADVPLARVEKGNYPLKMEDFSIVKW